MAVLQPYTAAQWPLYACSAILTEFRGGTVLRDLHRVAVSTVEVPTDHRWGVVNVKLTGNLRDTLDWRNNTYHVLIINFYDARILQGFTHSWCGMPQGEAWREETSQHCRTHYEEPCPERKRETVNREGEKERERERDSHSLQEVPCRLLSATCQKPPQCCFGGSLMHFDPTKKNKNKTYQLYLLYYIISFCICSLSLAWPWPSCKLSLQLEPPFPPSTKSLECEAKINKESIKQHTRSRSVNHSQCGHTALHRLVLPYNGPISDSPQDKLLKQ